MNKRIKKKLAKKHARIRANVGYYMCDVTPITEEETDRMQHIMAVETGPDLMDVKYIRDCVAIIG